jgi:formylglycine-generating enzyme required for sulfatase activity
MRLIGPRNIIFFFFCQFIPIITLNAAPTCPVSNTLSWLKQPSKEFVKVHLPAESLMYMGSALGNWGYTAKEQFVKVSFSRPFEVMVHEVTQAQYVKIMGKNPSSFIESKHCPGQAVGDKVKLCPNLPVDSVTWNDIQVFIDRLNQRAAGKYQYALPTEAQWELVAKAPTRVLFYDPFSFYSNSFNAPDKTLVANYAVFEQDQPAQVCSKKPTSGMAQVWDLHGNLWEWVDDCYGTRFEYDSNRTYVDFKATCDSSLRTIKGGSWDSELESLRISARRGGSARVSNQFIGFRLIRWALR